MSAPKRYRDMPRGAQIFGLFFIPLAVATILLALAAIVKVLAVFVFGLDA